MDSRLVSAVCPYLGRCDDPDSYFAFPTDGNCCYTEQHPAPIDTFFQIAACLGKEWTACPRYQTATSQIPAEVPSVPPVRKSVSKSSRPSWILVAPVAVVVLLLVWLLVLRPSSTGDEPLPATLTLVALQNQTPTRTLSTATATLERTPVPDATVDPVLTSLQSSATPASAASPAPTETPAATSTPTATSSATPTPTPSATLTQVPAATPSRSPTAKPAKPSPTPTKPAPAITRLPAPTLLAPSERQEFLQNDEIVLVWQPVDKLPADAYYAISVAYSHEGATWYDDVPWTRNTSWALSEHRYLLDLSDDGQFRWSVQVVRQTGVDAGGKPTGLPLSAPSTVRTLIWRRTSPVGTPLPPPP